jgi:hypothetical protein
MKHKRTLLISAVAVLALIITVATSLALRRSAQNAGLIPVTGPSSSGIAPVDKIAQQNQAVDNSRRIRTWESPEEEYVLSQQYHAPDKGSVTNTGESPIEEYILSQSDKHVASLDGLWPSRIQENMSRSANNPR